MVNNYFPVTHTNLLQTCSSWASDYGTIYLLLLKIRCFGNRRRFNFYDHNNPEGLHERNKTKNVIISLN